jgi:hypothetical protein
MPPMRRIAAVLIFKEWEQQHPSAESVASAASSHA